jgi:hypothetical protein
MCQRCHLTYDRHYYGKQRLAWIKTLSDTDLDVLVAAVTAYNIDVVGKYLGARARGIWGEDYIDALDEIHVLLQDEWDIRHDPPPKLEI